MRFWLLFAFLMPVYSVLAENLPVLPPSDSPSPHKLFLSSQQQTTNNDFDTWKIDSGYSYSLFDSVDIYVGARIDNSSEENSENGFLSGVSYNFRNRLLVKSILHTKQEQLDNGEQTQTIGAEVTSRLRISDNLDLHATLDYEEWQQGIEFGLGFRF